MLDECQSLGEATGDPAKARLAGVELVGISQTDYKINLKTAIGG